MKLSPSGNEVGKYVAILVQEGGLSDIVNFQAKATRVNNAAGQSGYESAFTLLGDLTE